MTPGPSMPRRCVLPCMGYGADGDHGRRYGRTLSPPRATPHPCRRPITSPEPSLEEPLHEHPPTVRTFQDPSSRRRSIDLDHRRRRRVHGPQLHGVGPDAFAQHAGVVAAPHLRGRGTPWLRRGRPRRSLRSQEGDDLVRGDLGRVLPGDGVRARSRDPDRPRLRIGDRGAAVPLRVASGDPEPRRVR